MLKAKMPNGADLSRISLAIAEKKNRDRKLTDDKKKAVRWMDNDGLPGGTYIDGGTSCEAYDLLKNESICEFSGDQFEILSRQSPYAQKQILDALSLYFDRKPKTSSTHSLQDLLKADYKNLAQHCPLDKTKVVALTMRYIALKGSLPQGRNLSELDFDLYMNSPNLEAYMKAIIPDYQDLGHTNFYFKDAVTSYLGALKKQEKCINDLYKASDKKDLLSCQGLDADSKRVFDLSSVGFSLRDMYRFVDLSTSDRDDYFKQSQSCIGKSFKIPGNLKCSELYLPSELKNAGSYEAYTKKISHHISKMLEMNTPVGVSLCTRFFKDPTATTLQDNFSYLCGRPVDPKYVDGEGSHAVTLIGQRCSKKGKKEYLLQNSWGVSCHKYHKSFDCTGKGGFWVPEDVLLRNTRNLSMLQ